MKHLSLQIDKLPDIVRKPYYPVFQALISAGFGRAVQSTVMGDTLELGTTARITATGVVSAVEDRMKVIVAVREQHALKVTLKECRVGCLRGL